MSLFDDASLVLTPNGYKASKLYSIKPTSGAGDMVVSRGTTATRVNSAGIIESVAINVPRLDYPLLGGCPKILVEPLRTNLFLRSEEFNLTWVPILATVTTNTTTAPDNTMTADKLVATGAPGTHFILQTVATGAVNGTTVTASVFVKAAGLSNIQMFNNVTGGGQADFILSGVGTASLVTGVSANIEAYPLGWYRCSMSYTPATTGGFNIQIRLADSSGSTSFTGNALDGVSLWGAQLETGTNATSYIPTVAGPISRNADVISKTGISSLIGQTEGTIFMDLNFTNVGVDKYILVINNTANTNSIAIRRLSGGAIRIVLTATTTSGTTSQSSAVLANGNYKIAYRYISGSIKLYINGALSFSETPTFTFGSAIENIKLGMSNGNTEQLNDSINSFQLYQTALENDQCIDLTKIT